VLQILF
jgi:hypothetical protein